MASPTPRYRPNSRLDQCVTAREAGGGSRVAAIIAASSTVLGRTYSNPVDLTLTLAKGSSPSLTLGSSGTLEFKAGFVPDLTSSDLHQVLPPLQRANREPAVGVDSVTQIQRPGTGRPDRTRRRWGGEAVVAANGKIPRG